MVAKPLGRHLIVDFAGCDPARLDDQDQLRRDAAEAARSMRATVLDVHVHRFQPVGVSVVVVLAESHLALHTWPEHRCASLDIFVCSEATEPERAKSHLAECLRAARVAELELERGRPDQTDALRWHRESRPTRTPGDNVVV